MNQLHKFQFIFTENFGKLILYAYQSGFKITLGETYRTQEQQNWYLKSGFSKVKYSNHQNRLAVDIFLWQSDGSPAEKKHYEVLADYWTKLHPFNRWGGHFKTLNDTYHFELKMP